MLSRGGRGDVFVDRREGGRVLAERLSAYAGRDDVLVLGLPRGGVPVAYEVATALDAPLDVFLVRKLGVPQHPELAMGAIASGGLRILNDEIVRWYGVSPDRIEDVACTEQRELERRERLYRDGRPPLALAGKVVILVDDGLATGSSMRAAVAAVRGATPSRVIVAVPVGPADVCSPAVLDADEVVCARTPSPFQAVGLWYLDFAQTTDEEVRDVLRAARPSYVERVP